MTDRSGERGEGGLKILLVLAAIGYGAFVAVKLVPAKADDGSFEHKVEETLKYAETRNLKTAKDIQYNLGLEAKKLNLDLKDEQIEVREEGNEWHAIIKYHRLIPLVFWKYEKDIVLDKKAGK